MVFLYPESEIEMLRLLEFFVRGLGPEDMKKLFGTGLEVCFKTPQAYVTFDRATGEFTTEQVPLSVMVRLPTALVLPGGLLMVERKRGWQLYDPRSHGYFPEFYSERPLVFPKLKLPVVFLKRHGHLVLMNGLTRRSYQVSARMEVVSPFHIILERGMRRSLYDLQTMCPLPVEEYAKLTPRFDSMKSGGKKYLLDTETGELYELDEITVSDKKLSRYLLLRNGEVIGYVEGTCLNKAHPSRPGVRH